MSRIKQIGAFVAVLLVVAVVAGAQGPGGIFDVNRDYAVTGLWTFSQTPVTTSSGSIVTTTGTQTLTNKTLTAPKFSTIVNTGTVTVPTNTGGLPTIYYAGNTTASSSAATSQAGATGHCYIGTATLTSGAATVDTLPIAFTGTDTYSVIASPVTGSSGTANIVVAKTSTSKITFAGTGAPQIGWMACGY